MNEKSATTTRTYSSTRRAAQAAQTRADIVAAAVDLFTAKGWSGTTMNAVAEKAGVSVETVYAGFKTKKTLLRAAADFAVVGDAEPVPYIERPGVRALQEGNVETRARAGMKILGGIHARSARVWQAMTDAAASDAQAAEWRDEMEASRRLDTGRSLAMVFGTAIDDETLDLVWAFYSPEVFIKLTGQAGWSIDRYEEELYETTYAIAERKGLTPRRRKRS